MACNHIALRGQCSIDPLLHDSFKDWNQSSLESNVSLGPDLVVFRQSLKSFLACVQPEALQPGHFGGQRALLKWERLICACGALPVGIKDSKKCLATHGERDPSRHHSRALPTLRQTSKQHPPLFMASLLRLYLLSHFLRVSLVHTQPMQALATFYFFQERDIFLLKHLLLLLSLQQAVF